MMANPLEMTGRRILVTGASSGIGRDTAVLLSSLGAQVILTARNRDRLEAAVKDLTGTGHRVEICDLADAAGIPAWLKGVAEATGPLHGLVHSAGETGTAPLR